MIVADGVARIFSRRMVAPDPSGGFDLLESSYDNSGNSIHAEAPFSLWDQGSGNVIDGRELRLKSHLTLDQTIDFANRHASHYVLSAANFLLFENFSDGRKESYVRLQRSLERLEIPLVVLGLGVQAQSYWNPTDHKLPNEAIALMKFLGDKCEQISVRGKFTASVFRDYAGVRNTYVTGCPSFFQFPDAFVRLREYLSDSSRGNIAFNATWFHKEPEMKLIRRAIESNNYWIGVDDGFIQRFVRDINENPEMADVPQQLEFLLANDSEQMKRHKLVQYFSARHRKFSSAADWIKFSEENVRFSYGTRFHANMATLLAGRPALWVAHDWRTMELAETLFLPQVTYDAAVESSVADLEKMTDYEPMFDNLSCMFSNFNSFLESVKLPLVKFSG